MTLIPPTWAFVFYAKLWKKFKDSKFSNEQAKKVIKDNNLNQGLSRLKRDGWLKITLNPEDARRSFYVLQHPETAMQEMVEKYGKEK